MTLIAGRGLNAFTSSGKYNIWRAQAGFTLVEILVVLGILGLIVGLVGPRVVNHLSESRVKAAAIQMESIATALELYHLDGGRYPTTQEGLNALLQAPPNAQSWNGPYLKSVAALKDPWGRSYIYKSPGESGMFDLVSMGPNNDGSGRHQIVRGATGLR